MVEGQQVTLTCKTTYYGLWGPTQNWTDNSGNILPASDVSAGNIIEYTLTVCIHIKRACHFAVRILLEATENEG